jgi:ABC-type maltose transport system permease subunit
MPPPPPATTLQPEDVPEGQRWGPWGAFARLPSLPPLESLAPSRILPALEQLFRRDEADVVLVVGNALLVAFEVIDWPVAAVTLTVHLLARSRFKGLEAMAEMGEETA